MPYSSSDALAAKFNKAAQEHDLKATECNQMQKVLQNDGAAFAEKCVSAFDSPGQTDSRLSSVVPGPAYLLSMDELLAARIERLRKEEGDPRQITAAVLDREFIGTEFLELTELS